MVTAADGKGRRGKSAEVTVRLVKERLAEGNCQELGITAKFKKILKGFAVFCC